MNIYAEHALDYFERGYPCIPTRQDTRTPLFGGYHGARKEPVDDVMDSRSQRLNIQRSDVENWVKRYPTANIAAVLPLNIMVIDVDGEEGEVSFLALADRLKLPQGVYNTTAGNPHWGGHGHYWYATEGFVATRIRYLPGLDIMGTGSLVHMPPTFSVKRNASYKEYTS